MDTIFAGPFIGEFGWELFAWQGYLRSLSKHKKIIVSSRTSSKFLYEDFCHEFIDCNPGTYTCDQYNCATPHDFENKFKKQFPNMEHIFPMNGFSFSKKIPDLSQKFIQYKSNIKTDQVDLVFHARMIKGYGVYKESRNWEPNKWNELSRELIKQGYKIASIGTSDSSLLVDGTLNYLDKGLDVVCSLLSKSKMIVGQSSGPMHFASLCKCPQFVWSSTVAGLGKENKHRYEVDWNPFKSSVYVHEDKDNGWNPKVNEIISGINKFKDFLDENRVERT